MPFCWIFLYPVDLPLKLLRESTTYFGYNPRWCFDASSCKTRLKDRMKSIVSKIRNTIMIAPSNSNVVQLLFMAQEGGPGISHRIFEIYPANGQRLFWASRFRPVSR